MSRHGKGSCSNRGVNGAVAIVVAVVESRVCRMSCGTPQVRGDEGKLCGGISTVDVRDERYEVNHCSQTEEMPNQVERR